MGSVGFHQWTPVILPGRAAVPGEACSKAGPSLWRSLVPTESMSPFSPASDWDTRTTGASELNAMEQVIGVVLVIVLIGLLADRLMFSPWERFMHRRWGTNMPQS